MTERGKVVRPRGDFSDHRVRDELIRLVRQRSGDLTGAPGAPGNDGQTPIKGVDYSDGLPGGPGIKGDTGSTGPAGPAPAGTGYVTVTAGVLGTPAGLPAPATHQHDYSGSDLTNKPASDPIAATAGLRTLGTGAQQACGGTDGRLAAAPNASYRSLLDCSGSHIAAKAAGTYMLGQGSPLMVSAGTGALTPPNIIRIDAADYPTLNALVAKLRIKGLLSINNTAPTGNFTLGLYPVTSGAGGAGLKVWTCGTVVSGSATNQVSAPAGSSLATVVGSDFALPADGYYVLAALTSATVATSSLVHVSAVLQMRNA